MTQPPSSQPPNSSPPPPPGAPSYRSHGHGPIEDPDPIGVPPAAPSRSRLPRLLGLVAALLAVFFVVVFVLRGGPSGLNPVAEAAERTAKMPGAHLAMEVTYTAEGSSNTIVGSGGGVYNARSGRARVNLTVPIPGHAPVAMESIEDERSVFLRSPMFAAELPPGTEWLGMEPFLGRSPQTAFSSNGGGKSTIETLKAIGGVERVDQQTVRGHLTTRYKGTVDLSKAAQVLSEDGEAALAHEYEKFAESMPDPVPVEAWIDGRGLTRQVRMVEQLPTGTGSSLTMDMRIQYYDFGVRPKIKLPPKHRVFDYTPVLRAELGMEDGHALGPLRAPAGAKPLSMPAFHRHTMEICRENSPQTKNLLRKNAYLIRAAKTITPAEVESDRSKRIAAAYGHSLEEPIARIARHVTRQLAALDPPTHYAADYHRYLKLEAEQAEWLLAQARALRLGAFNVPGLESHEAEREKEAKERKSLASRLGIAGCEQGRDGSSATTDAA